VLCPILVSISARLYEEVLRDAWAASGQGGQKNGGHWQLLCENRYQCFQIILSGYANSCYKFVSSRSCDNNAITIRYCCEGGTSAPVAPLFKMPPLSGFPAGTPHVIIKMSISVASRSPVLHYSECHKTNTCIKKLMVYSSVSPNPSARTKMSPRRTLGESASTLTIANNLIIIPSNTLLNFGLL